jgi:hypothetical protein
MKKNIKFLLIIGIIILAIAILASSKLISNTTIPSCLDISSTTICKTSLPTGYHQITGDCSSIGPNFKCYEVDSTLPGWTKKIGAMCMYGQYEGLLCPDGHVYYRVVSGETQYNCDLAYSIGCTNGCNHNTNECIGGTTGTECNENYMKCDSSDLLKCINGHWSKQGNTCQYGCEEIATLYARCKQPVYYCNGFPNCYESSIKGENCYDSNEKCMNNLQIYCLNEKLHLCTKRIGANSCLVDEIQSNQYTDESCKQYSIDGGNTVCAFYQTQYLQNVTDYGILGWRHIFNNPVIIVKSGCKISDITWFVILSSIILVIVLYYKRRNKK